MAGCIGGARPSPCFISESRQQHKAGKAFDMSNLPPNWYDTWKGDKREGCHKYPSYGSISTGHLEIFKNHKLMLPSERLKEHQQLKEGILKWQKGRNELFEYNKQRRVLERKHKSGILGIDCPLRPGTELYKEPYEAYRKKAASTSGNLRREYLTEKRQSCDALAKGYAEDLPDPSTLPRSIEIPLQRKDVDPVRHPYRFFDTTARLWPNACPAWDPMRAKALRTHQLREKHYDIITQCDNYLEIRAA